MLEKDIERMLTRGVEGLGGLSYKWVSPGHDGVPDRIIVMPGGHIYFVELKTDTGVLSPLQKLQQHQLQRLGCHSLVIRGESEAHAFLAYLRAAQEGGDAG